jgi:hypothetical protein
MLSGIVLIIGLIILDVYNNSDIDKETIEELKIVK